MSNEGLHASEFDSMIEADLEEIKRKVAEIMKMTFEQYGAI